MKNQSAKCKIKESGFAGMLFETAREAAHQL
jgi:hypothetical protein